MTRFAFVFLICFGCFTLQAAAQDTAVAPMPSFVLPETDDGLPGAGPIRRHDWFKNLWKNRRAKFAAAADSQQGAIVFFGDSITQGWQDDFRGDFGELKVANRGISGDTTRGMLIRMEADVLDLNPSAVVMLMGTNDLEEGAEPNVIADNVALIIAGLKAHNSEMPIVLCNVFPSSETKKRPAAKIKAINEQYAANVKGNTQVTVLDTWTLFADGKGDAKVEEFPDLLHPNKIGYAKWQAALLPVFSTLELTEEAADDFQVEPGFESLFNGKDLTGWTFLPTTEKQLKGRDRWKGRPAWPIVTEAVAFDGKTSTTARRYIAKHGRLIVTMPPEGRKIQQLWTTKTFTGDFTLKLEFRATPNADSGVFLKQPQLQCRDFVLAGPYKKLKNYRPQQWNELMVQCKAGKARCTCNGEIIEAAFEVPETGPIGLEGDRGQVEYRRIRIKQ